MKQTILVTAMFLGLAGTSFGSPVFPIPAFGYSNITEHTCADTGCSTMDPSLVLVPTFSPVPIAGAHAVSNSFEWLSDGRASFVRLVLWGGSGPASLDWAITTEPFGGTTLASAIVTDFTPEERARGMFLFDMDLNVWLAPGKYWLQLSNAVGVDSWDVSDGPSLAYQDDIGGAIKSESFSIALAGTPRVVPEPTNFVLLGSGMLVAAVLLLRKADVWSNF